MKHQIKRLATAAAISSSVFAVTYYWYHLSGSRYAGQTDGKPLAYVGDVNEDIQRRPAARLLWQPVNQGEALFNGEAIRTSERGEVRILFADSDRYLDLEPESLIVIKKGEGEISLDLMEGSLFVNASAGAKEGDAPGIVLNSASGKVDLSKASASLSKTKGQDINVQVLEGKASIKGKDGESKELSSGASGSLSSTGEVFDRAKIKIISPMPAQVLYRNPEKIEPVAFKWTGFPEGSEVSLWAGETRRDLKVYGKVQGQELLAQFPIGKHYWKLVASNNGTVIGETPLYRNELAARIAATGIYPLADADIESKSDTMDLPFKWHKGNDEQIVTLEVWGDPEAKNLISRQQFKSEDSFTLPALREGSYYWRLTSSFPQDDKPLMGPVQKFTVKKAAPERPQVQIAWTLSPQQERQTYVDEPRLGLQWSASLPEAVSEYRVRIQPEDGNTEEIQVLTVTESSAQTPLKKPGRFIASIEALGKDGSVLGVSPSKTLEVSQLPKISASQFLFEGPKVEAGKDGKLDLSWSPIEGAKEYELVIFKNGKELKRSRYTKTETSIRNLMPGEYQAKLITIDSYGRPSEAPENKTIVVPENSGLKAPSLKKIKVN